MHVIRAHNVNDAYRAGMRLILAHGQRTESRNGPVLRLAEPVSTVYTLPHERVLFDRVRHANPFFHLFEALWMLNGQNDVKTLDGFLKHFRQFSDDGVTFHGAYGHRWRHWPVYIPSYTKELDQIKGAIQMLKRDPTSRRVVISMWDPVRDLDSAPPSKDIPCNDMIKLAVSANEQLNMIIFNRSNDVVWGCYGANAVHMSMLHEYIAQMTGLEQGTMTQISCDFHAYLETPYNVNDFASSTPSGEGDPSWRNPYEFGFVSAYKLVSRVQTFDEELRQLMLCVSELQSVERLNPNEFTNAFFADIAIPMHRAWELIRANQHGTALRMLTHEQDKMFATKNDWLQSGIEWIEETLHRRMQNSLVFQKEA